MKIPKTSRFMGRRYKVEFVEKVSDGDRYGETDNVAKVIRIEESADHDQLRETLLHEVIHQVAYMTELALSDEDEERVATLLGRALLGHMRDNHSLWLWLMKKETPCTLPHSPQTNFENP